jgi:hypothetical protein
MSKLWTAAQAHYRPTVAYQVSVVLIESIEPIRAPLPVLTRGRPALGARRDPGIEAGPGLIPPVPTIKTVLLSSDEPTAGPGETVELLGHHLNGTDHSVRLSNDRLEVERTLAATANLDEQGQTRLQFVIPAEPAADPETDFPVGVYRIDAHFWPPGETNPRATNRLAVILAPSITKLPRDPVHLNPQGTANFTIEVAPAVRSGQSVLLILGQHAYAPEHFKQSVSELHFAISGVPIGDHLVRLRIEGIDSSIVERGATPPRFLDQRIEILPS